MKIIINHSEREIGEGLTLADVLVSENLAGTGIAVAVDNKVVPRAQWKDFIVTEGARLTVITAVCGG